MKTITLDKQLTREQEQWIVKNIGPRMHYLHNSIGGLGWIVKKQFKPGMSETYWELTLEDDKLATFFVIKFST